jgi:hypothetical protein
MPWNVSQTFAPNGLRLWAISAEAAAEQGGVWSRVESVALRQTGAASSGAMNPRRALVFETKMTLRQPAPNPLNEWQWGSRHLPRPNGGRAKRPAEPLNSLSLNRLSAHRDGFALPSE